MKQIKILSKLELMNVFSLNVIRHTKDKKAKRTAVVLGITVGIIALMIACYTGALSYGFVAIGVKELVPSYIVFLSSIFTLVFCAFKTGKIIFKESCYDILASMPLKKSALVISRYIRLYTEGLVVACVVMLPGIGVYACTATPGIPAVLLGLLSVIVVPIIPVTLSVLLGVLLTGITSKMKHKVLFETLLTIGIVVGLLATTTTTPKDSSSIDLQTIEVVAKDILSTIHNIYPPASWFASALGLGSVMGFLSGTLVSIALFVAVIALTTVNFEKISRNLHANTAGHDFKLGEVQSNSFLKAMVLREAKRYFSSSVYVTNTILGPVMAVGFAVGLLFADYDSMLNSLPVSINTYAIFPVLFAGILGTNNPIITSVSMEGKEFWIIRTLPVADRDILKSKLIFHALLLAPFYIVGEIFLILALQPNLLQLVWMILLPITIAFCTLETGLFINLKFPKLAWNSDVEVVKQSASATIGGFAGIIIAILAAIPLLLVPINFYHPVACGELVMLVMVTILIHKKNATFDFKRLH